MNNNSTVVKEQENTLAGIVGAFLFSLVGGILWFVLYQIGFFASVSGFIGIICAVKGYMFFSKSKNEGLKCVIISSVATVIVLIVAWYFCVAYDLYLAVMSQFNAGYIDFTYTFFESVRVLPLYFMEDSSLLIAYLADLGGGLLCAVLGVIYYLSIREKRMKAEAAKKASEAIYASAEESNGEEEAMASEEAKAEDPEEIKYDNDVE